MRWRMGLLIARSYGYCSDARWQAQPLSMVARCGSLMGPTGHDRRRARARTAAGNTAHCRAGRRAASCRRGPINGWWPCQTWLAVGCCRLTCSDEGPRRSRRPRFALEQIGAVRKGQPAGAPRPVVTLDSGYDLETLAHATIDADLLVRLISRVVYRTPLRPP
jgi:hypothetical protein